MPIILNFSAPITNKRAVERSLEIWTSERVVGAWYWDGDQTLYFRPRNYWPANTTVRFVGHLDGVEGAKGVFGVHTLTQHFEIGRSLIAVAGTRTHHLEVYLDGKLFADWPISTGKPGDDTPNGTYLTMDKTNPEEMIGPGYDIFVPWSVRFTLSGDFIHDAFWSVNDQGFDERQPRLREPGARPRGDVLQDGRAGRSRDDHRESRGRPLGQRMDRVVPGVARPGGGERVASGRSGRARRQLVRGAVDASAVEREVPAEDVASREREPDARVTDRRRFGRVAVHTVTGAQ